MARNTSKGVIQVLSLSVIELNRALQEISTRLDTLEGLRGPVTIDDALNVAQHVQAQADTAPSATVPLHGFGDPASAGG